MRMVFLLIMSFLSSGRAQAHVRTLFPKADQIIEIHTAMGIATIIQTPLAILPAISGDQTGFRVEYLERSTIIKPLRMGAKTNLFLLTPSRRYNLRLTTGAEDRSDYVVYLKDPATDAPIRWSYVGRSNSRGSLKAVIVRVGMSSDQTFLIELTLQSSTELKLKADDFWVTQGGDPKIIDSLYISKTKASNAEVVRVVLALSKAAYDSKTPLKFELRSVQPISLQLPSRLP